MYKAGPIAETWITLATVDWDVLYESANRALFDTGKRKI